MAQCLDVTQPHGRISILYTGSLLQLTGILVVKAGDKIFCIFSIAFVTCMSSLSKKKTKLRRSVSQENHYPMFIL